jgi:hypothetical protein
MRILTVRQPWGEAIIFGGKDVENRLTNIAGDYQGPVAIHTSKRVPKPEEWLEFARTYPEAMDRMMREAPWNQEEHGVILGVVDLLGAHLCVGHCSDWALPTMTDPVYRDWWHLELANPRPLREPIAFKGALGLRKIDAETISEIERRLP